MKRKRTSDVVQSWNTAEIPDGEGNSKMIWCWWRQKEHRMLFNIEILLKFIILRKIQKWSNLIKRKKTSHVAQWPNIVEIHHRKKNSQIGWFWWTQKEHRTYVYDEILLKFTIMRKFLKCFHFDQEKKDIGRCSTMKYCWNSSYWPKFWNDLIWWRAEKTSDFGQWTNIHETHHDVNISKIISFWWREKEHPTLLNEEILLKLVMVREIRKWSDVDEEKKNIGLWSMLKYCWNSSLWGKFWNDLISWREKDLAPWSMMKYCLNSSWWGKF